MSELPRILYRRAKRLFGKARNPTQNDRMTEAEASDVECVKQSGLFDDTWYLDRNPDVVEAKLDAVSHYVRYGYREGREPSPRFDSRFYLARYPDVAEANLNPLVHYLRHGKHEGRKALPPDHPCADGTTVPIANDQSIDLKIGVVIHAFYVDVLPELLAACENIPGVPSFYIAVTNNDALRQTKTLLKSSFPQSSAVVEIVPNVGRNVSTFTTLYGARILRDCDLVCHLHTKASKHAKGAGTIWRHDLVRHLLSDRQYIRGLVRMFETTPTLGVASPSPYERLDYWAYTALSNRDSLTRLCPIIGIPYPPTDYFDYPLGCMFWARPAAIRQLLDGRIAYTDFPAESGQLDGTLAHAIERSILLLAKQNGYSFIEVNGYAKTYRENYGARNYHQYAQGRTWPKLMSAIKAAKVVSFDIFDTLITRTVLDPDDVKRMVGEELDAKLGKSSDFVNLRRQAESDLYASTGGWKVTYDMIYDRLAEIAGAEIADFGRQREFELERQLALPRSRMVDAYREAKAMGKRVTLVSDMYLERPRIAELLRAAGVTDFDEIYLSCELGLRKHNGTMWPYVLEKEAVEPPALLHIGDNEQSDAQLPGDLKIETIHVLSPRNLYFMHARQAQEPAPPLLGSCIAEVFNDPLENR